MLETICPDASIPKTIADVLQGLENITALGTLPGAYPRSISSVDDDSFETASGTFWFTTTETSWMTAVDYSLVSMKEDDAISVVSHSTNQGAIRRRSVAARGFAAVQRRLVGRTALIKAAGKGDIGRVKTLLDLNVNTEMKDQLGRTALHWAAERRDKDVVELLLEYGADIAAKRDDGSTVLLLLHSSAYGGQWEVVKWLVEHGADVTAKGDGGSTVLHQAANGGHLEVVKWLVEHGADVAAKDNNGSTVLHWAADWGHLEVVKWLVEHGVDVTAKDNKGSFFDTIFRSRPRNRKKNTPHHYTTTKPSTALQKRELPP